MDIRDAGQFDMPNFPINLDYALKSLSIRRPIFHSEADFQHELAWDVRALNPELSVRLERPFPGRASGAVDLVLSDGQSHHAIELKYLAKACKFSLAGEDFNLKQQGAQDIRRYDVCKDIERMEAFCAEPSCTASVIVLANDPYYWRTRQPTGTCAEEFDIWEGRQLAGELAWAQHTGAGTKRKRESPITLRGSYRLAWLGYSDLPAINGHFRFLHIRVQREAMQRQ